VLTADTAKKTSQYAPVCLYVSAA